MKDTGLKSAKILLPNVKNLSAFSCVACDQFTGDRKYWENLKRETEGNPTALDLIFPEVYLSENAEERIKTINLNMEKYLEEGLFKELPEGFILTVRTTPFVKRRIGIIGAIDLEKYEYGKKTNSLIRATEGTIEERIPPRLKIRENAPVEFPHVMVLFDDEKREISEYYYNKRDTLTKLYDFELNMGGGKVEGYFIEDADEVLEKFSALLDKERLIKKYGKEDEFAFAVGDGNHSLATAKAHWERVKKTLSDKERETHPARFALAEFNNIYDEGIYFEPIYRFVSGVDTEDFIKGFKTVDGGEIKVYNGKEYTAIKGNAALPDGISATDDFIKQYIEKHGGAVDYIHGEKELKTLVDKTPDSVGILFNKLEKGDLFKYVSNKGAFPRKTFSMGEGVEKRYYLEGRRIK